MSRTTQYIGLTLDARKYVEAYKLGEPKQIQITTGMFEEPVMGSEWELSLSDLHGPNKKLIGREKLQACPWSSGPMIFTCLQLILVKDDGKEIDFAECFQWVMNPTVQYQIDEEKGHYWV